MKIQSVTICNFKNYPGENSIDLTPDPAAGKNIILIGGKNGAGKTTLFEAVQLCMFGSQFQNRTLSKAKYENYLRKAQNKDAKRTEDPRYFIEADLELDDVFPIYSLTLRREWNVREDRIEESFTILRDGIPFEIVSQEYWEDYINTMIPPYITDYFFFDGERLREIIAGDETEDILRKTARDLIGLKLYETLIDDLTSLRRKVGRKAIKSKETKAEVDRLDLQVRNLETEISLLEQQQVITAVREEELRENISTGKEELQRKAGAIASERKRIEEELKNSRAEIDRLNSMIEQVLNFVPFVMAGELGNRTVKKLKAEKIAKELASSRHLLESIEVRFEQKIKAPEYQALSKRVQKDLKNTFAGIISDITGELKLENGEKIIHDISHENFNRIEQFFHDIEAKGKVAFRDHLLKREEHQLKIKKLEFNLKTVPDDSIVSDDLTALNQFADELGTLEERFTENDRKLVVLRHDLEPLKKRLDTIEYDALQAEEDRRKVITCDKVNAALEEFILVMLASKVHELEELILSMHRLLANKEDQVVRIVIDPESFHVTLFDSNDEQVDRDLLSAGEKEIFALSVLWGLSKLAKTKMPVIADSLLGRLDDSHVETVATIFLPIAAEQVIVLSHSREVDKELYAKMKPHVHAEYLLSYDKEQKISAGYFFEVA